MRVLPDQKGVLMPEFFHLVSPDDARAKFMSHIEPCSDLEIVPTHEALGRVLAVGVASPQVLPEFRRSTVDGYAVQAQNTFGASESLPAYLRMTGEVPMGRPSGLDIKSGEAVIVHTGGMLPESANAVVMV